jgi:hypothetical protein
MIIILHDQTAAYNCRSISRTAAAQAIKYEVSPNKIAATKLIDESGLQESNPRPSIDLPPTAPSRHLD